MYVLLCIIMESRNVIYITLVCHRIMKKHEAVQAAIYRQKITSAQITLYRHWAHLVIVKDQYSQLVYPNKSVKTSAQLVIKVARK